MGRDWIEAACECFVSYRWDEADCFWDLSVRNIFGMLVYYKRVILKL